MQRRHVWAAALALGIVSASGCSNERHEAHPSTALSPIEGGCAEVERAIRAAMVRHMNRRLDENLERVLAGDRLCSNVSVVEGYGYSEELSATGGSPAPSTGPGSAATQHSDTNVQVEGVDEPDFVKTDGGYLYLAMHGALVIADVWPPADAHETARVPLLGKPLKLFLVGDRAIVYSALPGPSGKLPNGKPACTYGYDCDLAGDGSGTAVSVFDVADRSAPRLVRRVLSSGSLIAARRVGDAVHTVLHERGPTLLASLPAVPEELDCQESPSAFEATRWFEKLRAENTRRIWNEPLGARLPTVTDATDPGASPAACSGWYAAGGDDGFDYLSLLSVGGLGTGAIEGVTLLSRPGAVYASPESLYVAVRNGSRRQDGANWRSAVHRFAIDGGAPRYAGSGSVPGFVLNQFSMDEHAGFLRIATTSGRVPDPEVQSTLSVLEARESELAIVGQVTGIAPTEDIRSVRFDGERAFVVTFKKTDPLFVFDLADPRAPRILSELKIPGFSTYMQRIDDDHLLTIGYDADDQGSFAYFQGVMLQLFDVSDATAPKLVHKEVIGTRGSSSEALTNHLAFTWFGPKELLALPMTVCTGDDKGSQYGELTFSGLLVYDVDAADGFALTGKVGHPMAPGGDDSKACRNWWTRASSEVKRSFALDDFVASVSETRIKLNALSDLKTDLASVELAPVSIEPGESQAALASGHVEP